VINIEEKIPVLKVLRIKGLYMFQALIIHPQEALHKLHLVYCMPVMSVGYTRIGVKTVFTATVAQPIHMQYTKWRLYSDS
jgi:hypothetical protein